MTKTFLLEFFDREIPLAICATRLIEINRPLGYIPESSAFIVEYIFRRTIVSGTNNSSLPATINETIATLYGKDLSATIREYYTRGLSTAAVVSAGSTDAVLYLKQCAKPQCDTQGPATEPNVDHLLAAAAYLGHKVFFEKMPQEQLRKNSRSIYFGTALQCAAKQGHYDITRLLLEAGLDVKKEHLRDGTALQAAAFKGQDEIVQLLLDPKYKYDCFGEEYEEAILCAARGGHLRLFQFLLGHGKIKSPTVLENRILIEAAEYGHEDIVRVTLDNGANPNHSECARSYWRPLELAALRGHARIVRLLLAAGATRLQGARRDTLYLAARGGFKEVVQILLDDGADINRGVCRAAIVGASRCGKADMVEFLLKRGVDLGLHCDAGHHAIFWAAENGHESVIRILVAYGVDPRGSCQGSGCLSPMMSAMVKGHDNAVRALIELGAVRLSCEAENICKRIANAGRPTNEELKIISSAARAVVPHENCSCNSLA